jgi:outer membrane protein assembly factor BamB
MGGYQAPAANPYVKWQFAGPWPYLSVAIVDRENIFVSDGKTLHALNPTNGAENWSAPLPGGAYMIPSMYPGGTYGLPTFAPALSNKESTVYAASATVLAAFDKKTGNMLWNIPLGINIMDPYVAPDGAIVVTSWEGVYSVNSQGGLNWEIPIDPLPARFSPFTPPTIGPDGKIYFGTVYPIAIVCLNSAGLQVWEAVAPTNDDAYFPLTLNTQDPSGTSLYAASQNGVTAYSASNGTERWNYQVAPGAQVSGGLAVDSNSNQIYVPSYGFLVALNLDGSLAWKTQVGTESLCTPSVDSNSLVLVEDAMGMIYALDSSGKTLWSFNAQVPSGDYYAAAFWYNCASIGTGQTVYASGESITAISAENTTTPSKLPVSSPHTPGGLWGVPWLVAYYMSQGMSITQVIERILSGNLPPVVPPGPVPGPYAAYRNATNTWLIGAQSIMLSLTTADSASSKQLADRGLKMMEQALRQFRSLTPGAGADPTS